MGGDALLQAEDNIMKLWVLGNCKILDFSDTLVLIQKYFEQRKERVFTLDPALEILREIEKRIPTQLKEELKSMKVERVENGSSHKVTLPDGRVFEWPDPVGPYY